MPLEVPGYTLQDVVLGDIKGLSISRVQGGDFSVSYLFNVKDEEGDNREQLSYTETLSGAELAEFAAFVSERLPAINAWWPGQIQV